VSDGGSDRPLDPEAEVERLIDRLERSHTSALPRGSIPPADVAALASARIAARAAAEGAGRGEALSRAQRTTAEWTLKQYQREGFGAAYLGGWLDTPERRLEVVDVMVDAATAFALADLLSDDTRATLTVRFDELHDGPTVD
jgi:flavin-dependent dehydrogenase